MNRQMRRITEKSEKKKEKEKTEKLAARRARIVARRESRKAAAKPTVRPGAAADSVSTRASRPRNRFIGVLALINVMVVSYGAFLAPAEPTLADTFMNSLLYITLGYFLCRWLLGRGLGTRALYGSVFAGLTVALGLELTKFFLDGLQPNPANLFFILPALLLGAFAGVFIERKLHGR